MAIFPACGMADSHVEKVVPVKHCWVLRSSSALRVRSVQPRRPFGHTVRDWHRCVVRRLMTAGTNNIAPKPNRYSENKFCNVGDMTETGPVG